MSAVQIVTIKSLRVLYKNGEPAERIELANVEEHGFDIVVQKGLYVIGDSALYVQPDYCLPLVGEEGTPNSEAVKLFLDFTMPDGDPKKSKLGKMGRIRAIKFNFQLEGSSDPVYSVGIMMPMQDINNVFTDLPEGDLDGIFEVTKYEEPESARSGMAKGALPSGMYATDETNIKNLRTEWPMTLTGTLKVDGSSITVYYRNDEQQGICSRNLEKKLDQTQIIGYTTVEGKTVRKHYDKESNVRGWMVDGDSFPEGFIGSFHTEADPTWIPTMGEVEDTFVKLGTPVLEKLRGYCLNLEFNGNPVEDSMRAQIALRGELCGTGLKGSGNKSNPHSKLPQQIIFYAADDYSTGVTKIVPLKTFYYLMEKLGLNYAPIIFTKTFNSMEELSEECGNYFRDNLIEGIVVKNDDATFSAKFMNPEYDSRK